MRSLLYFAAIAFTAQSAMGLCPAPKMKVCTAFFASDKVFYGKVVKITPVGIDGKHPGEDDLIERHRYTIQVEQALKGEVAAIENVETENDSGRWISELGEHRVLFVHDGRVGGWCSPIDEGKHAQKTIRQIRALRTTRRTMIEGELVAGYGENWRPVPGRTISVYGNGRSYKATTDHRGTFTIAVAPGRYRIESEDLYPIVPYSRTDTHGFDLARGECAQFQFSLAKP